MVHIASRTLAYYLLSIILNFYVFYGVSVYDLQSTHPWGLSSDPGFGVQHFAKISGRILEILPSLIT